MMTIEKKYCGKDGVIAVRTIKVQDSLINDSRAFTEAMIVLGLSKVEIVDLLIKVDEIEAF
ncbi:MAG: hypothetical protein R6X09_06485 [Bacteroidales bacterium]